MPLSRQIQALECSQPTDTNICVQISPKERDQMKVVFDKYADGNVIKAVELKVPYNKLGLG